MHLGDVQDDDEINSNENNSDARNDYGEEPIYAIITPKSMRQKKAPVQNDEVSIRFTIVYFKFKPGNYAINIFFSSLKFLHYTVT